MHSMLFLLLDMVFIFFFLFDLRDQLEFLKEKRDLRITDWAIYHVALDSAEAEQKRTTLQKQGITALFEPLKFAWKLPIKTVADQYKIYVPADKKINN